MNLILLKNFNNYFNRKIIKYETYEEYVQQVPDSDILKNINFIPNDGITTEQIINWTYDWTPDYLLCINDKNEIDSRWFVIEAVRTRGRQYKLNLKRDVIADYYNEVLDSPVYVEKGVIDDADSPLLLNREGLNVNQIKTKELLLQDASKCAWLVAYLKKNVLGTDKVDDITVNVKGAPGNYKQIATTIENWRFYQYSTLNPTAQPMLVTDSFKMVVKGGWLAGSGPSFTYFRTTTTLGETISSTTKYDTYTSASAIPNIIIANPSPWGFDQDKKLNTKMNAAWDSYVGKEELYNSVKVDFPEVNSKKALKDLQEIVNIGRIRDSQGKYYKVNYTKTAATKTLTVDNSKATMYNIMKVVSQAGLGYTVTPNNNCFGIIPVDGEYVTVELVEEATVDARAIFPSDGATTNNPLYDIICMPYNPDGSIHYVKNGSSKFVNSDVNLASMYSITTALGGDRGYILDLQLLPYCPIQSMVADGHIEIDVNADNVFRIEDNAGNFLSGGFIAPSGEFTFDVLEPIEFERPHEDLVTRTQITITGSDEIQIGYHTVYINLPAALNADFTILNVVATSQDRTEQYRINNYGIDWRGIWVEYEVQRFSMFVGQPSRIVVTLQKEVTRTLYNNSETEDIKVANECDMYRLVSPNYNGIFEFNLMKNNKRVNSFNVDCQYKPFNPYIHVNPDFAGLYGSDFNDSRGLVCAGDFSIGVINDAFHAYEIQNKNYQNIFNRQIENMDVNNAIARQEAVWQVGAGTLQGAVSGAAGAGMASGGNPYAAAAGAVIGGATSFAGGLMDLANLDKRQGEARDFTIDNYNYSLQNIKALPQSISKTSPITPNNKLYPFVEYYTCTDVEKDVLRNKLKYDGMSVGIIDKLGNWSSGNATKFVRGQLIRCEAIAQDAHLLEELYKEINKGVYL